MMTATPAPSTPGPVKPAMGDDEGGETEIGLGLAAAGREEQQIGDLAVGVLAIGKPAMLRRMKASWNGRHSGVGCARGSPVAPALRRRAAMATARFM